MDRLPGGAEGIMRRGGTIPQNGKGERHAPGIAGLVADMVGTSGREIDRLPLKVVEGLGPILNDGRGGRKELFTGHQEGLIADGRDR